MFVVLLFEFETDEPPVGEPTKSGHKDTPLPDVVLFTDDALDELTFVISPLALPRPPLLLLVLLVLVLTLAIWAARLLVSEARLAAAIESNVGESPRPSSRSYNERGTLNELLPLAS